MHWTQEAVEAATQYRKTRVTALRHNPAGYKRSHGIRRDQVLARSTREYRAFLTKHNIQPRRGW